MTEPDAEKLCAAFLEKARDRFGNALDYSEVRYVNAHTSVRIVCHEHGVFDVLPMNFLRSPKGCLKCTRAASLQKRRRSEMTECVSCGSRFYRFASRNRQKFCSKKCRIVRIATQCAGCGVSLMRTPSQVASGKNRFCGIECSRRFRKACAVVHERACAACGKVFHVSTGSLNAQPCVACSQRCAFQLLSKMVDVGGVRFSVRELADGAGLSTGAAYHRIKKHGWRALLEMPPKPTKRSKERVRRSMVTT